MTSMTTTETPSAGRRWLIAHDFSAAADSAADLAADELADTRGGGSLVLLHVYLVLPPSAAVEAQPIGAGLTVLERQAAAEATQDLERVAARLRERLEQRAAMRRCAPVRIETAVQQGTPAETILSEAAARRADRIILGTHGRKGVSHLLLGSVAERVVRRARVPVLVVHGAT